MPAKPASRPTPDHEGQPLSSVRALIPSVTKLAKELELAPNSIYRWIKVNRIPGRYVIKVAAFYDVEVGDLIPLTGSDISNDTKPLQKPKATLEVLLQVFQGKKTLEKAADELGTPLRALKLVMFHWGDDLPTLYTTLKQLEEKRISLDEAAKRLKVTKYTLHGIRRKYGYAPGKLPRVRPRSNIKGRREAQRAKALDVITGRLTAEKAAEDLGVSYRTMFRCIERTTEHRLSDLSHWPQSFRAALAEEIEKKVPEHAEKWLKFVEKAHLVLKKRAKYPKTPPNWRDLPVKRLLVGILMGEASLEEVAASRGADPSILAGIFTSDLKPLGVAYDALLALPITHHVVVSEILLATLERKRRLPA